MNQRELLSPSILSLLSLWVIGLLILVGSTGCTSLTSGPSNWTKFIDSKPSENRLSLARLAEKRRDYDKAIEIYNELLQSDPENLTALHRLGVVHTKLGRMDTAASYFDRALRIGTPSVALWNDHGYHCYLKGDLETAESSIRRALELDDNFAPAWTNLGLVLGELKRYDDSRMAFGRSATGPSEVHASMGYMYAQSREFELAQKEYRRALDLDPTNEIAAHGLLEVSRRIPGREPVTVVKTTGSPHRSESRLEESGSNEDTERTNDGGSGGGLSGAPKQNTANQSIQPYSFQEPR